MKKQVILLGGGASVKEGINKGLWDKIKGHEIWSLNYGFMTMPYLPNREIWIDISFFRNNIVELQKLSEKGVPIVVKKHMQYADFDMITQYNASRDKRNYFGKDAIKKNMIYSGSMGLVGIFALSLAIAENYNLIYLLGYDFGTKSLKETFTHYYQDELKVQSSGVGRPVVYRLKNDNLKKEVTDFELYTKEEGVDIYNVSMNSNIPYFSKVTWEDFFGAIQNA